MSTTTTWCASGRLGARVDAGNFAERTLKPVCVAADVGEMVATKRGGKLRAESWVSWHTFRHTCASQLFRDGWNAKQVSRFLGHADAGLTLRTYVHVLDEDLPEPGVLASLDRLDRGTGRVNEWINNGSTEPTETGRSAEGAVVAPIALPTRKAATMPNPAEVPFGDYESAALTS